MAKKALEIYTDSVVGTLVPTVLCELHVCK